MTIRIDNSEPVIVNEGEEIVRMCPPIVNACPKHPRMVTSQDDGTSVVYRCLECGKFLADIIPTTCP